MYAHHCNYTNVIQHTKKRKTCYTDNKPIASLDKGSESDTIDGEVH